MFDPETIGLIRRAPPLEGLDLENLPQLLTDAFATVVAARIRLRTGVPDASQADLEPTLTLLNRLAAAHESYVALLPDRENRASAAFVAASAHQARRLGRVSAPEPSRITTSAISSEISAALLFLVAEAYPDAAEAAKRITPDDKDLTSTAAILLKAIRLLAEGKLNEILELRAPDHDFSTDVSDQALSALLGLLLQGVEALAQHLIEPSREDTGSPGTGMFQRVKALCVQEMPAVFADGVSTYSVWSGPLHLANLLIAAERDLADAALAHLPAPSGVDPNGWRRVLKTMSRHRPFLWHNHREAIQKGFLDIGRSAAISFPTGGGKSTLAELKIATALLNQRQVVFLAPTHALVGQTVKALERTFSEIQVFADFDEDTALISLTELPQAIVTTPERCLMLLAMQPEAFVDLGLIVFDECHLLHADRGGRSRRGLDAMLCLLNLTLAAPDADLLLMSAMMKNTGEIADWVKELTGRDCLTLDLAWKPTRQVRGCVVYDQSRLDHLVTELQKARLANPAQKSAPIAVKKGITARPYGLFGLRQTWDTNVRSDYALRALVKGDEPLAVSTGNWRLTPNGNQVSAAIAAGSVAAGMKTLVFVQNIPNSGACVNGFASRVAPREVTLTDDEQALRALTVEEMGGPEYCFLTVDPDGIVRTGAAAHHSSLLREERDLHESLFKRRDGVDALFATSTLAQGMNLPSEVVIICGDSRFDPSANRLEQLQAHELLNAAGRAGRAGEGAQGFVLLVPSHVISFDDANNRIGRDWTDLRAIFEQSDQCLVIDDPLEATLDLIHASATDNPAASYLLSRLPLSVAGASDPADAMLRRSFAAHRARARGDENWIDDRVSSALAARPAPLAPDKHWIEVVAASTGVSRDLLEGIANLLDGGLLAGSAGEVMGALLDWIAVVPDRLKELVRPETLEGLFGTDYSNLPTDEARARLAIETIQRGLPVWMAGAPLCKVEMAIRQTSIGLRHCERARHFALRVAPDLAFIAGLPARLLLARQAASAPGSAADVRTVLAVLASIVREGCDSPESLATRMIATRRVSRVGARRMYEAALPYLALTHSEPNEDFGITRDRVQGALSAVLLDAETLDGQAGVDGGSS
jgi:hypothetical protein